MVTAPKTFGYFFLETKEELERFLLRRLNCPHTAADLAQETYLRLLACEQKSPSLSRKALAFSIAGNLAVDHIRKERVRARFTLPQDDNEAVLEIALSALPDVENRLMAWQDLDQVQASLDELEEECQTALYLSMVEGLTYVQIGELMGVTDRMVARRIAKALKHCQDRRAEGDCHGV